MSRQDQIPGYQILQLLGEGGTGSVYQARQLSTGQTVALKLLNFQGQTEGVAGSSANNANQQLQLQRQHERFIRETELCAQLHHAHIVRLLDRGQCANGQLFAAFEYVPGETLKQYLLRHGAMPAALAGQLMGQVLDALACAHAQGIAHRDLKPQNIMITQTGTRANVKVLDFGIATLVPEHQQQDYRQLTLTRETMGTPSYSAPEQLRGEPPTVKSDLYAWGLLFLECLTGRAVLQGMTLAEIFHKQLSPQEIALPPALIGHPLADFLRRVLQKDPQLRAAQAANLYQDFQAINLANLVGVLEGPRQEQGEAPILAATAAFTSPGFASERAQITALAVRLSVQAGAGQNSDQDLLEALQRDQLSLCSDIVQRYGGYVAGQLGDCMLFYFGYPHPDASDARRAARTALELASQVRRRGRLLYQQHKLQLELGIGMHTGFVFIHSSQMPSGLTPNLALRLQSMAAEGQVLVSAPSRRLLQQFVQFEEQPGGHVLHQGQELAWYRLLGEHNSEAFSFLRNGKSRKLIGRSQELQQIFNDERQLQHACILISGQAGIGKSRLSYEICLRLRSQGAQIIECRCLPEQQNNALFPVLQMLRQRLQLSVPNEMQALANLQGALQRAAQEMEIVLPVLCSWFGLPLPSAFPASLLSPDLQKQVLMDALQALIWQMGTEQSLLLVVEDLHWVDLSTLEFLQKLRRSLSQDGEDGKAKPACHLLLTCREQVPPALLQAELPLLHLPLQQLSNAESAQLLQAVLAGKPLAASALEKLCARVDGIPLFAEELVQMLEENGMLLAQADGSYQLTSQFDSADIPLALRDFLAARLSRLGSARETAQLAACIGREFDHHLLQQITSADEAGLQHDLQLLIELDLLYRQRKLSADSYLFRHALIRDAAYDSMPRQLREQTHAKIAFALQAHGNTQDHLPQLANHFARAALYPQAVQYGSAAAAQALQRAAHDDVIDIAQQLETWLAQMPVEQALEPNLVNNRVKTHALMFRHGWTDPRVKNAAELSLQLLQGIDPESEIGRKHLPPSLWSLALYHQTANNRIVLRQLNTQMMQVAEQIAQPGLSVACHAMRGVSHWIDGNYLAAEPDLRYAIEHYDEKRDGGQGNVYGLDGRAWSMATLANVVWFVHDDKTLAYALARQAIALAEQLQHIPTLGLAWMYLSFLHQQEQDHEQTRQVCEQALAIAQKYGLASIFAYTSMVHSWACRDLQKIDQFYKGLQDFGCMMGMTYYAALGAECAAANGDQAAALRRCDAALALAREMDEHYYSAEILRLRAGLQNTPQLAKHDLEASIAAAQQSGMWRSLRLAQEDLANLKI